MINLTKLYFILVFSLVYLMLSSQTAYVVNSGSMTLSRIDIAGGEVDNAFAELGNQANRVAVWNDLLLVVDSGDNNIRKLDKETGEHTGNIYIGASTNPYDIFVLDDHAYVTGAISNRLYKIDLLTDAVIAEIAVGNNPAGIAVWNNKMYVGNTDYASGSYNSSLSVVDLNEFEVIGEIETNANPQYLISYGDYIHVACTGNWIVVTGSIQIVDPLTDSVVETLQIGGYPGSLTAMNNGNIYIGDSMNLGIYAYNAADLEVIYDMASPFLPGASTVTAAEGSLYTLGGEWGQNFTLNLYNSAEEFQNSFQVGLYATDVVVEGAGSGVEDDIVENELKLTNYPNPFNPSTTISFSISSEPGFVKTTPGWQKELNEHFDLCIYNIKGQKIRNLPFSISPDLSLYKITWDGTDQNNQPVPSGIYFYQLTAGNLQQTRKMLLMK